MCVAAKHRGAEWTRGDGDMGDFFAEVHPCWAVHIEVRPVVVSSLRHLAGTKLGGTTGPPPATGGRSRSQLISMFELISIHHHIQSSECVYLSSDPGPQSDSRSKNLARAHPQHEHRSR